MPLWLACVLLVLDLAALVYFRRASAPEENDARDCHVRVRSSCRAAAALPRACCNAPVRRFAKLNIKIARPVMCCNRRAILSVRKA